MGHFVPPPTYFLFPLSRLKRKKVKQFFSSLESGKTDENLAPPEKVLAPPLPLIFWCWCCQWLYVKNWLCCILFACLVNIILSALKRASTPQFAPSASRKKGKKLVMPRKWSFCLYKVVIGQIGDVFKNLTLEKCILLLPPFPLILWCSTSKLPLALPMSNTKPR